MKIIYNNILPLPGFKAINLFGIVFAKKGRALNEIEINHEAIHTAQMKEMWYVFFYLWYIIEWIVRLFQEGNAYKNISFEQEAYANQIWAKYYLKERERFAWFEYIIDEV